eukprot:15448951-Alexandrium_andersonii.AAC.1
MEIPRLAQAPWSWFRPASSSSPLRAAPDTRKAQGPARSWQATKSSGSGRFGPKPRASSKYAIVRSRCFISA